MPFKEQKFNFNFKAIIPPVFKFIQVLRKLLKVFGIKSH
jgi:hypothetical protein